MQKYIRGTIKIRKAAQEVMQVQSYILAVLLVRLCQAIARAQTVASHCSAERTTDVEKRPILISSFFQPRPEHEVETAEAL